MNRRLHVFHRSIQSFIFISLAVLVTSCQRSNETRHVEWPFDPSYAAMSRMLAEHAKPDGFDYAALAEDPGDLKILKLEFGEVTEAQYHGFSKKERLAFLVNAHNLFAIDRIMEAYPVDSIEGTKLFGSAIEARDIRLAGRKWSLLEMRDTVMGPEFKDVRAISLLNWGMRGCPPLPNVAATAENIDVLLERQTAAFMQNDDYNQYVRSRRKFMASPLWETYWEQIERDYTTMHHFVERFSTAEIASTMRAFPPRIQFRQFDTSLNDPIEFSAMAGGR